MTLKMKIRMLPYEISTRIKNYVLVKKYPWLKPMTWNEEEEVRDPHYDYRYTALFDNMPGWWKAFGRLFCDEIQEHYKECPDMYILETKEKYGQLRITMANANKAVNDICGKYEFISQNVCYFCGRPHTFMTDTGWILPICPECYERKCRGMKPYSEAICEEDNRIPYTYQIHHTNKDNDWYEDVDISETVIKIEENYDKHRRSIWRF